MPDLPDAIRNQTRLPAIAAPMFLVSGPELVCAACRSGIVGSFPAPNAREIETLDASIEGDVNYGKYLGKPTEDRPGLQGLDVTLSVETAGDADLDAWLSAVEDRCPVSDNVSNETEVSVTLE